MGLAARPGAAPGSRLWSQSSSDRPHKYPRPQIFAFIPPVARAAGAAAGTGNALGQPFQFLPIFYGLQILLFASLAFIFFK